MKRVASIFMLLGFLVDKINIVESMSSILKVTYICFAGTIVAFFVYYRLARKINK